MRFKLPLFNRKKDPQLPKRRYTPVVNYTVNLDVDAVLPKKDVLNPLWTTSLFKGVRENKYYEDVISNPVRKFPINPKLVMVLGIVGLLFLIIGLPVLNQQGLLDPGKLIPSTENLPFKIPGISP